MAVALAVGAGVVPALAADPDYLTIGVGSWEVFRNTAHAAEFDLGYRSDLAWWLVKPQAGVVAVTDGDYYAYGGLAAEIPLAEHILLIPSVAAGAYGGHGYRLGAHVEFRSGGGLAWQFEDLSRVALGFYHISNAGLTQRNPGDESLILEYHIPFGSLL